MHIGDRIKRLRIARNLTQTELARRADVPQSFISKLEHHERDNPSTNILRNLALALGCTTDYLSGMHEVVGQEEQPV